MKKDPRGDDDNESRKAKSPRWQWLDRDGRWLRVNTSGTGPIVYSGTGYDADSDLRELAIERRANGCRLIKITKKPKAKPIAVLGVDMRATLGAGWLNQECRFYRAGSNIGKPDGATFDFIAREEWPSDPIAALNRFRLANLGKKIRLTYEVLP